MRTTSAIGLPPPADQRGYTAAELRELLSADEYDKLDTWLRGQTCVANEVGQLLIYPWDVERGVALIRYGTPTYFD